MLAWFYWRIDALPSVMASSLSASNCLRYVHRNRSQEWHHLFSSSWVLFSCLYKFRLVLLYRSYRNPFCLRYPRSVLEPPVLMSFLVSNFAWADGNKNLNDFNMNAAIVVILTNSFLRFNSLY